MIVLYFYILYKFFMEKWSKLFIRFK